MSTKHAVAYTCGLSPGSSQFIHYDVAHRRNGRLAEWGRGCRMLLLLIIILFIATVTVLIIASSPGFYERLKTWEWPGDEAST